MIVLLNLSILGLLFVHLLCSMTKIKEHSREMLKRQTKRCKKDPPNLIFDTVIFYACKHFLRHTLLYRAFVFVFVFWEYFLTHRLLYKGHIYAPWGSNKRQLLDQKPKYIHLFSWSKYTYIEYIFTFKKICQIRTEHVVIVLLLSWVIMAILMMTNIMIWTW